MSKLIDISNFKIINTDGFARRGKFVLKNGIVDTPVFMPVGTYGTIKAIEQRELFEMDCSIILGNAFHLWLRPGLNTIIAHNGLNNFMGWNRPIITDSGGFQIFSLNSLCKITEDGAQFKSPINGDNLFLSPEISIQIQKILNSDIIMQLDSCCPYLINKIPVSYKIAKKSMSISIKWAKRSINEFYATKNNLNKLFCIIQGGMYKDLREESLSILKNMDFHGFAIGGLSVGEPKESMISILNDLAPNLPFNKPHYLMGVGTPEDIVMAVSFGIDMFDCVLPTRNARNGKIFTRFGDIKIRNSHHRNSLIPIDENCGCYTCCNFTRSYLHHLHRSKEILGAQLSTIHNLYYYLELMKDIRESIENSMFEKFCKKFYENRSCKSNK